MKCVLSIKISSEASWSFFHFLVLPPEKLGPTLPLALVPRPGIQHVLSALLRPSPSRTSCRYSPRPSSRSRPDWHWNRKPGGSCQGCGRSATASPPVNWPWSSLTWKIKPSLYIPHPFQWPYLTSCLLLLQKIIYHHTRKAGWRRPDTRKNYYYRIICYYQ